MGDSINNRLEQLETALMNLNTRVRMIEHKLLPVITRICETLEAAIENIDAKKREKSE